MGHLGLGKWNRTANLQNKPIFPYRNDYSVHVNENNIKKDFGYQENLGWLTTYLPDKIVTGYDSDNFLCKKIKFPYYKDPSPDCTKDDDSSCLNLEVPTLLDDRKSFLVLNKEDLSDYTFQDDFMVVGHESYERLADKLYFNIIENCRYYPQLPLTEIERKRTWLKYLEQENRQFPSWREPLINKDLSIYTKVIPKQVPICMETHSEKSYMFGVPERIVNGGCQTLELKKIHAGRGYTVNLQLDVQLN